MLTFMVAETWLRLMAQKLEWAGTLIFKRGCNYPVYKIGKIMQKSENIIWPG